MNIIVCIKQVPDKPNILIDKDRMTINREGVEGTINPLDYVALEAALIIRAMSSGKIIILTMGPPQSEESLIEALTAGADQAILLSDTAFAGADTLATSHVLSQAIKKIKPFPDLILCGNQTTDSDTGHVGPQIAEELGLPQICGVTEINPNENNLIVKQLRDRVINKLKVRLPALLTVSKDLANPHYIPLSRIEKVFCEKKVEYWNCKDLNLKPERVGLMGSATLVSSLIKPQTRSKGDILKGTSKILSKHLIKKLEAMSIINEE